MLTIQETHVMGQILNTTFGKSSTVSAVGSVKCHLYGSEPTKLCVDYTSVVTFASEASMREQKKVFENESNIDFDFDLIDFDESNFESDQIEIDVRR